MPELQHPKKRIGRRSGRLKPGYPWDCRKSQNFLVILIILCFFVIPASIAAAASFPEPRAENAPEEINPLKMTLVPASIDLPLGGGPVQSLLLIRNTGDKPLHGIAISPIYNERNLRLDIDPPLPQNLTLFPGEQRIWILKTLPAEDETSTSETVIFLAYYGPLGGPQKTYPGSAYTVLSMTRSSTADVANVKLETALGTLDQQHPGKIFLIVTNKIDQSIVIQRVLAEGPDFIRFEIPPLDKSSEKLRLIPPFESRIIPIEVEAQKRVQPGKHVVAFTIQMAFGTSGHVLTRNAVLTQIVDVGVLGEAVILKILSVPSFLLIPGILALITWGLLWKWGLLKLKKDKGDFLPDSAQDPKSAQFWVIAVTISMLVIMGYRFYQPGILTAYGLVDFVYLWFLSVLIVGFGGYLALAGGRRRYILRRTPSAKDSPVAVIEKLSRQGLNVFRETVTVTEGGKSVEAFALQKMKPETSDSDTLWVGPGIEVIWKREAPAELKGQVDEELKLKGDAKRLAKLLKTALRSDIAIVIWKKASEESTEISSLSEVKSPDYKIGPSKDCMVVVTTE
jgi:hypothetical protein